MWSLRPHTWRHWAIWHEADCMSESALYVFLSSLAQMWLLSVEVKSLLKGYFGPIVGSRFPEFSLLVKPRTHHFVHCSMFQVLGGSCSVAYRSCQDNSVNRLPGICQFTKNIFEPVSHLKGSPGEPFWFRWNVHIKSMWWSMRGRLVQICLTEKKRIMKCGLLLKHHWSWQAC